MEEMEESVCITNLDTYEVVSALSCDIRLVLVLRGWRFSDVLISSGWPEVGDIACANGNREVSAYWEQNG